MDVQRVENEGTKRIYMEKRTQIMEALKRIDWFKQLNADSCDFPTSMGVRTQMDWVGIDGMTREPVDHSINEFYLMHGTEPAAAEALAKNGFHVDLAGSLAGTLYGRGVYFAESSGKGDEYATPDDRGLRPLLLWRA